MIDYDIINEPRAEWVQRLQRFMTHNSFMRSGKIIVPQGKGGIIEPLTCDVV